MYESVKEMAYRLRLFGIHASAESRCQEAVASAMHPSDLIRLLLEDEQLARRSACAKRLATRAKFRTQCDLTNWDQATNRGISKAKLKELTLLNFYHKRQNLIVVGPTGVGKTHLAIGLGRLLCDAEIAVHFSSTNLFFEQVQAEKAAGRYLSFVSKMKKIPVIVIDDFALREYSHDEANVLLEILEERYAKGLVIVTSQVSPQGWKSLFTDQIIAEAIIDRLINPSDLIELKGESYRKKRGGN